MRESRVWFASSNSYRGISVWNTLTDRTAHLIWAYRHLCRICCHSSNRKAWLDCRGSTWQPEPPAWTSLLALTLSWNSGPSIDSLFFISVFLTPRIQSLHKAGPFSFYRLRIAEECLDGLSFLLFEHWWQPVGVKQCSTLPNWSTWWQKADCSIVSWLDMKHRTCPRLVFWPSCRTQNYSMLLMLEPFIITICLCSF